MSEIANQLLETFDSLPEHEQHEVVKEILRRSGELPDTFLTDEDLTVLADELFQFLDAEEANDAETASG